MLNDVVNEYIELDNQLLDIETSKNEIMQRNREVYNAINELELKAKDIISQRENMKEKLIEAMTKAKLKVFKNDVISLTYIGSTTKKTFDSKKLKLEMPEIYRLYTGVTPVKGYLKITNER
jgi:hypothetical protein